MRIYSFDHWNTLLALVDGLFYCHKQAPRLTHAAWRRRLDYSLTTTSRLAQQSVLSVVHVVMEEDPQDEVNLQAAHIVDFANRLGSFKWFAYLEDDMKFLARHFFHMVGETRHLVSGDSGMFASIGGERRLLLPGLMRYEFGNWSRCAPPIPSAMALSTCHGPRATGPLM